MTTVRRQRRAAGVHSGACARGRAAGVDGVFMEVHDNPKEAKSTARTLWSRRAAWTVERIAGGEKALDVARATP